MAILRSLALIAKKMDGEGLSIRMYLAKPLALEICGDSMSLIEIPDFMHLPGVVTADWISELNRTSDARSEIAPGAHDSTPAKPQHTDDKLKKRNKMTDLRFLGPLAIALWVVLATGAMWVVAAASAAHEMDMEAQLLFSFAAIATGAVLLPIALDWLEPFYLAAVLILFVISICFFGDALIRHIYDKLQSRRPFHHHGSKPCMTQAFDYSESFPPHPLWPKAIIPVVTEVEFRSLEQRVARLEKIESDQEEACRKLLAGRGCF